MSDALDESMGHLGSPDGLAEAPPCVASAGAVAHPLVAVVTPAYNGANYLREVMECVQAQTYPNLVHVVLDNCSTDETPQILKDYANARVPVLTARNESVLQLNANWNAALQLVPKEAVYVRLICHDDLMTPDSIERMVDVAERRPSVGAVISDVRKFNEEGTVEVLETFWPKDTELVPGAEAIRTYFRLERVIISNQVMFRKSAMQVRGREFYAEDTAGSDYDAVLAVLAASDLGVVHGPVSLTRLHGLSETSTTQERWRFTDLEWFLAMSRHGPAVYSKPEWADLFGRYKRRYLRRMLKWSVSRQGREVVARHLAIMRGRGLSISFWDWVNALIDGVPVKLGLKEGWTSYPW